MKPTVIVTLGNFATRFILEQQIGITRAGGRKYQIRGRDGHPDLPSRRGVERRELRRDQARWTCCGRTWRWSRRSSMRRQQPPLRNRRRPSPSRSTSWALSSGEVPFRDKQLAGGHAYHRRCSRPGAPAGRRHQPVGRSRRGKDRARTGIGRGPRGQGSCHQPLVHDRPRVQRSLPDPSPRRLPTQFVPGTASPIRSPRASCSAAAR